MVSVARKNLFAEKTRLLMAVGGVAFAVFLTVLIQGVYFELRGTFTAFIDDIPAQLWVTQEGAFDVFHSNSRLGEDLAQPISEVPGVAAVQGLTAGQVRFGTEDGGNVRAFVVGMKGSPELPEGGNAFGLDAPPGPGEAVMSDLSMRQADLAVGDLLFVGDQQFRIIGTTGEDVGFRGFSFLSFGDAQQLLAGPGVVNYFAVFVSGAVETGTVAAAIDDQLPSADVFTQSEFASSSREEMDSFDPVLAVLMVVAFIVGAAVVSLTIYTATVEKAREFGVMKAIGASSRQLYRIVLTQSFAVGLLGFVVGLPLAIVAGDVIERFVPEFVTVYYWQAILGILGGVLAMSLIAAYLPVRSIARVDPAVVFRA